MRWMACNFWAPQDFRTNLYIMKIREIVDEENGIYYQPNSNNKCRSSSSPNKGQKSEPFSSTDFATDNNLFS